MEKDVLTRLLEPFSNGNSPAKSSKIITKVDFFCDKLTGCDNAAANRARLCEMCELPSDMTPNALLEAMNLLYGYDAYRELILKLSDNK